ncbi:flavodoxin domain-containing protein [Hornefia butyriciproducens]|uniref:flavodoxin domain-containing protein n=1 Tax=Hornefia butyriciproducens TaxID=2652293 RepID=UPI003D077200
MNAVVVYYSRYGATEKYARWIAEALGADLIPAGKCRLRDLEPYDTIVYGGGIYSGGIRGVELITKNWYKGLSEKRVFCFGVGITIEEEANRKQAMEINFGKRFVTDAEEDKDRPEAADSGLKELFRVKLLPIPCWFLPGAFDPSSLRRFDKGVMKLVRKMMADDPANAKILEYIDRGCDLVDKSRIGEIVAAAKDGCEDK